MRTFPRLLATAAAAGTMLLAAAIPASATPAQTTYAGESYGYASAAAAKQAAVNNALANAAAAGFSAGQCLTVGVPSAYPDSLNAAPAARRATAQRSVAPSVLPGTVWDGSATVQCLTQPVGGTVALERYNGPEHLSTTSSAPAGYSLEGSLGWLYSSQVSGTHALYQCKIWGSSDTFTSVAGNCEGQQYLGQLGFVNDAPPAGLASRVLRRCTINGEHFDSNDYNCEGQVAEGILGYTLN
jgi:hypothetical protein